MCVYTLRLAHEAHEVWTLTNRGVRCRCYWSCWQVVSCSNRIFWKCSRYICAEARLTRHNRSLLRHERLTQIVNQIIDMLDSHAQAHEARIDRQVAGSEA